MSADGLPSLVIWDLDGTLVDSRSAISETMDAAFSACGLPPPGWKRTRTIVGLGLEEACAALLPESGNAGAVAAAYREAYQQGLKSGTVAEAAYDGMMELVRDLHGQGVRQAIATGKSRRGLDRAIATHDLVGCLSGDVCASDGPGKPDPWMIDTLLARTGARREAAVMVGDAVHDMAMAFKAGVRAVGVSWGFGQSAELLAAGAETVAETPAELAALLASAPPVRA